MIDTQPAAGTADVITWRRRSDLVAVPLAFTKTSFYTVKDPIASRFFQLREEEYFLLQRLDGSTTVSRLQDAFNRRFAPLKLGSDQLRRYLTQLEQQGLIVCDQPGHGLRLHQRSGRIARAEGMQWMMSFLAIRFRGIDPQRFLRWLYPRCVWLFHPTCAMAAAGLVVSALVLVTVQFEVLVQRLPELTAFFNPHNLLWLGVAVAVVKILHELGHALTCRHFGGECHEMGVMLLVFSPCLYCDVSDAWLMPNKWHRIVISAAGIVVELVLAAFCTFLWWFTEPGLLNTLFLNIMLVSSVNTLLFNGNPLLRFDGYFVLADLVDVPNLKHASAHVLRSRIVSLLSGQDAPHGRMLHMTRYGFLTWYALAAIAYRMIVITGIVWMFHSVLGRYGLLAVAQLLTTLLVIPIAMSIWREGRETLTPVTSTDRGRQRLAGAAVVLLLLCVAVCIVPLPHRISAVCQAECRTARTVFVSMAGRVPDTGSPVQSGDRIRAGDVLVRLQNSDVDRAVLELEGRIAVLQSRLEALDIRRLSDGTLAAQIPATQQTLADLQQQLSERQLQQQQLSLVAPVDGIILRSPVTNAIADARSDLKSVDAHVMDRRRAGDTLSSGTEFCQIGNPDRMQAVILVDQADIDLVRTGQSVRFWLDAAGGRVFTGTVEQIAETELKQVPRNLVASGRVPLVTGQDGPPQPANVLFRVRASLNESGSELSIRGTGYATITTAPQTIIARLRHFFAGTFRFSMDFSPE